MSDDESNDINRREMLGKMAKAGLVAGGAALIGPGRIGDALAASCWDSSHAGTCGGAITEAYPTSPHIGGKLVQTTKRGKTTTSISRVAGDFTAFSEELPIPTALEPVSQDLLPSQFPNTDPTGGGGQDWDYYSLKDSSCIHQIGADGCRKGESTTSLHNYNATFKDLNFYRIELKMAPHNFTNQMVVPINAAGNVVRHPKEGTFGQFPLPPSTIYGFNGTFPGPMINAQYGKPNLVRFANLLDVNPDPVNLSRQNFGAPDQSFLTHLHNGHTAPESDGNPFYKTCPYGPGTWVDNLYLNWAADGQDCEKQSFFWFHDHRMDHTGANVYKGMVGLYPIYDPVNDSGDERTGFRLPGVKEYKQGLPQTYFNVKYDIPLAFYDCRLDDGVTTHQDFHSNPDPTATSNCSGTHPEWWGKTYFKHFPDHGFVGDIFTVNGKAYPVLHVKRRRYRFRFLDASISRQYEFKLMRGKVGARPGQQGQYNFTNGKGANTLGEQCMKFRQIAADGGLLPFAIDRDSIEIWPAKRREVIIDFRFYQDGQSVTRDGDEIYLANILQMLDGRKRTDNLDKGFDPNYCVPVLKFVIDGNADEPDDSAVLLPGPNGTKLRDLPPFLGDLTGLPHRVFKFDKQGVGGETLWTINGRPFDPARIEASVTRGVPELWTFENAGGGWTHPVHIHMEEHQVISRDGKPVPDAAHPDDRSREDVVALEGSESVTFYRNFRTFTGPYVAHCHNLAHEDHAMMFGWEIKP